MPTRVNCQLMSRPPVTGIVGACCTLAPNTAAVAAVEGGGIDVVGADVVGADVVGADGDGLVDVVELVDGVVVLVVVDGPVVDVVGPVVVVTSPHAVNVPLLASTSMFRPPPPRFAGL